MQYLEVLAKTLTDPHDLLLGYVEAYRNAARREVAELPESELYARRLPTGWTPLELLKHLTYMERRWFEWGFAGVAVPDPIGDEDPATGRWQVGPGETLPTSWPCRTPSASTPGPLWSAPRSRRSRLRRDGSRSASPLLSAGSSATSFRSTPAISATWT